MDESNSISSPRKTGGGCVLTGVVDCSGSIGPLTAWMLLLHFLLYVSLGWLRLYFVALFAYVPVGFSVCLQ